MFKEWLDTANADGKQTVNNTQLIRLVLVEKQLVLEMLKAGNNKEKRIQKAAEELLQPDVLPNVQDWLTKLSEKGK